VFGHPGVSQVRRVPGSASLEPPTGQEAVVVIALTAFAMKDDRQRFLDAGFDGYLDKPINVKTFPDQVRHIYERARK
jgi:CheY-like chemotaxis protein